MVNRERKESRSYKHWSPGEDLIYSTERGITPNGELATKLGRSKRAIQNHGGEIGVSVYDNDSSYTLRQIARVTSWSEDATLKALIEGRLAGVGGAAYYDGRWHIKWDGRTQPYIVKPDHVFGVKVVEAVDPVTAFRCHNCHNFNSHRSGYCSKRCLEEHTTVLPALDRRARTFAASDFPPYLRPNFQGDLRQAGWLRRRRILRDERGRLLKTKELTPYQKDLEQAFLDYPGIVIPSSLLLRALGEVEDTEETRRRLVSTVFRIRERLRDRKSFYCVARVGYGIGIRNLNLYQAQLKLQRILWQHSGSYVAAGYLALNLFGDHTQAELDSLQYLIRDSYSAYKNSGYKFSQVTSDHLLPGVERRYYRITQRLSPVLSGTITR